jgi:pimeloyl-ACP methyl ester carboxylesterase
VKRWVRLGSFTLAALAVAYVAVAVYVADRVTRVDRSPVTRSSLALSPVVEDVELRTEDGLTLRGWFVPSSPHRAAVLVHGKDGNRFAGDHTVRVARYLLEAEYSLLLFDLRGHGESEGERFSLGQHERRDVAAAVDHLIGRGFSVKRIVLVGESMGAGVAIQAVALRPEVAGVIADSSYSSGRAIVDEAGPGETGLPDWYTSAVVLAARLLFGLDVDSVDPDRVVRAHPEVAFFFIHCDDDGVIGLHHALALREASGNPATRLWIAEGCGHAGAADHYSEEYRSQIVQFAHSRMP